MHPDCQRFMFMITPVTLYLRIPGARASFRIITSYYFTSARHINTISAYIFYHPISYYFARTASGYQPARCITTGC